MNLEMSRTYIQFLRRIRLSAVMEESTLASSVPMPVKSMLLAPHCTDRLMMISKQMQKKMVISLTSSEWSIRLKATMQKRSGDAISMTTFGCSDPKKKKERRSKRRSVLVVTMIWSAEETLMEQGIGGLPKFQMESGWSRYSLLACTRSE